MSTQHVAVMLREVLEALRPRRGGRYVDGTLGGGGHAAALLEASAPDGQVLGLDADAAAIERAAARLAHYGRRATLVQTNFRAIGAAAREYGFAPSEGIVLDLGLSSDQLAEAERGFSFRTDAPLDMRFDRSSGPTAADLLNEASEEELADIFFRYGEERRSRRLARAVAARRGARTLTRTTNLVEAVEASLGGRRRLHPATRAFQALRIAVNDELGALEDALVGATDVLAGGGRLAVISFHSLEDRIVKRFFQARSSGEQPDLQILTRKPLVPQADEQAANPRSRSAKLRVAERTAPCTSF